MRSSIALLVVFYPGIEKFIDDFIFSLRKQSCKDFDLIVVNDAYSQDNIQSLYPDLNIFELKVNSTISRNREYGINYIIRQNYKYLIFCDADDYYSTDRVKLTIESLSEADIVVNDLNIISFDNNILVKDYLSRSITVTTRIDWKFLLGKNLLGFSNKGLRVSRLREVHYQANLKIVDWYFYTLLLREGLKVKYIPSSLTFYRQHADNLIGIGEFTVDLFKRLSILKLEHYTYLTQSDLYFSFLKEKYTQLVQLNRDQIELILGKIKNKYPLWWESINF